MVSVPKTVKSLEALRTFQTSDDLRQLFIEILGWGRPQMESVALEVDGTEQEVRLVAELAGFLICEVRCNKRPTGSEQRAIDRAIELYRADRLVIFTYPEGQTWRWPKVTPSNSPSQEVLEVRDGTIPLFLAHRLAGLSVTAEELLNGLALTDIRTRVRGQFDSSTVTKKFYDQFKSRHDELSAIIQGISDQQAKTSYATLTLNRLMFLYFLQKKGFLNGDLDYLRTCLRKIQELNGEGRFYNFYRDCLLPMCFNGLNENGGTIDDAEVRKIIGTIPYVNGGLFEQHKIEASSKIAISDSAFEEIFDFFDSFVWHLDTRLTGNPNEINPDVLGYIFEQYINFTSKGRKDKGAYYTKKDVTSYMVDSTLALRILEVITNAGVDVLGLVRRSPELYIPAALSHGINEDKTEWILAPGELSDCWQSDPQGWGLLDATNTDDTICLPGETWVEMFHRRERYEQILRKMEDISELNLVITYCLDARRLIRDAIEEAPNGASILKMWKGISETSVLDPTCGSGAFLFAALELLEESYLPIIETAESFDDGSVGGVTKLLTDVRGHVNSRYFVRKHAALHNLFGTDIMEDAIETAKLRIFLSLVACVDKIQELEPLPDLDFNLRCGNLLVGFANSADANRIGGGLYVQEMLTELQPDIEEYLTVYQSFVEDSAQRIADLTIQKSIMKRSAESLRLRANEIYAACIGIRPDDIPEWSAKSRPLHWFLEFPGVIGSGGFQVIVGNPPYIAKSKVDDYDVVGFKTLSCPDLYAQCYERSLNLLAENGRHAFVVMLNLAFSNDYSSLRRVIAERGGAQWWSTYGKRPDSLFTGIQVRNTIVVVAPGNGSFMTRHNIFTSAGRTHMFQTLEYVQAEKGSDAIPVRSGIAHRITDLMSASTRIGTSKLHRRHAIYLRPSGAYWFPALFTNIPLVDTSFAVVEDPDPRMVVVPLAEEEDSDVAAAICAGKIGYLWWSAVADDFDVSAKDTVGPRSLIRGLSDDSDLKEAASAVKAAVPSAVFASVNAKKLYMNVRWSDLREVTDVFDYLVLTKLGLESEWRNLNIWYRQVMRSGGENNNSIQVPEYIAKRYF